MRRTPRFIGLMALTVCVLVSGPAAAQEPEAAAPDTVRATPAEAATPAATRRTADPDADSGMALLFSLNNVLVDSSILSGYRGLGLGLQLTLTPDWSVRGGLDLTRITNPAEVQKVTTTVGGDTVASYTLLVDGPTQRLGAVVSVDLVRRLGNRPIAPYAGFGLTASFQRAETVYTDDISVPDQVRQVDDLDTNNAVGLQGILGVGWRIHESISLFAEYNLGVGIAQWTYSRDQTTLRNDAGAEPSTTQTLAESGDTRWLNLDTALGQGASLGLMAHF